jgi:hypothetical protein
MAVKTMVKAKKQSGAVSQNAFAGQAERPTQKAVESAWETVGFYGNSSSPN